MAKMQVKANMSFEVTFTLTEDEARALRAISIYGSKSFLRVFYEHLGKSALEPHEKGLTSLFEKIRDLEGPFTTFDNTRKAWRSGNNIPI